MLSWAIVVYKILANFFISNKGPYVCPQYEFGLKLMYPVEKID